MSDEIKLMLASLLFLAIIIGISFWEERNMDDKG